jgi:O-antigen/teichoic acid export membrane protein
MGVTDFGSFSFTLGWIQLLAVLCALGLTTGVLRFIPEYLSNGQWGLLRGIVRRSPQLTMAAGVGVALTGSSLILFLPLEEARRTTLLVGMWLVPLIALGSLKLEITRATRAVARAYFPMRVFLPAMALALGFLTLSGTGSLSATQGLYALAGALILTLLLQHHLLGRALPAEGRAAAPEFRTSFWLSESFPLLLIAGFVILLNQTDIIMVGLLTGDREAGLYAGAAVTARWVNFMLLSANAVAAPLIAALHAQGERGALQALVSRVARWTFWPSLAVAGILMVAADPVLTLFGEGFSVGRWALMILVLGQLVNAGMGPVGHLMNLTGHGRQSAVVYGTAAGVNVILNLLLIPRMGLEGAAVATAFSMVLWNLWLFVLVQRKVGIHSFFLGS